MSLRLVLYCEGTRESGVGGNPAPGEQLATEMLGPAHLLTRRVIANGTAVPEAAIQFVSPLRTQHARVARGSELLKPRTLRQLLTWPSAPPHVAIVLVDQDGIGDRKRTLEEASEDCILPRIIAVSVQEFESWLIADQSAIAAMIGKSAYQTPDPESLRPGEAKAILANWIGSRDGNAARMRIVAECSLEVVASRCPSFQVFTRDLLGWARAHRP